MKRRSDPPRSAHRRADDGTPDDRARRGLETAAAAHQAGEFARAQAPYREALERDPGNADALHLMQLPTQTHTPLEKAGTRPLDLNRAV